MEEVDTYEKFINFVNENKLQYTLLVRNYDNYSNSILSTFIKRNFIKTSDVVEHHDTRCHQVFVPMVRVEVPLKSITEHYNDLENPELNVPMYLFTYSDSHAEKELNDNTVKIRLPYTSFDDDRKVDIIAANDIKHIEMMIKQFNFEINRLNKGNILKWDSNYGSYRRIGNSPNRTIDVMVGLNKKMNSIVNKIDKFQTHKKKMLEMGITSGINVLFFGPPGTGKTSLAKIIADYYGVELYITNLNDARSGKEVMSMLSPKRSNNDGYESDDDNYDEKDKVNAEKPIIVLIEDFDRFIKKIFILFI